MRRRMGVLVVLLVGCGASRESSAQDGVETLQDMMPDDLPAGTCRGTGSGSGTDGCDDETTTTTTGPEADGSNAGCAASEECQGTGACVATWDDGVRGAFACRFACVPLLDDGAWCIDDASCCDAQATCTPRGYCVVLDADVGSSGGSSSGGDASTGGTTGGGT